MTGLLDTSVVMRYLTGEPATSAAAVARLLDAGEAFVLTDAVILETAFVLRSQYRRSREEIVDVLLALIQHEAIVLDQIEAETMTEALLMCRPSGRVSFGDALIWARAVSRGDAEVVTADHRFPGERIVLRRIGPSAP